MKIPQFRLWISALLAWIMILLGCYGLVFISLRPLQVLSAIVALIGSLYWKYIHKNLKKRSLHSGNVKKLNRANQSATRSDNDRCP